MRNSKLAALRAAFPYTVPIFTGFWFLGMAYGMQMSTSGFAFWYPMVMSAVIYGGSLEFHVNGMGNETFEAVLVSIDQMVDNANRSIKVYARVAHPQKDFRPGMYVSARKSAKNE